MLDPWIIEQIRRREEERKRQEERPTVDMPEYRRPHHEHDRHDDEDREPSERGVVIIDFSV